MPIYVFTGTTGAGGPSVIEIQDENNLVSDVINKLNFIGEDVVALQNPVFGDTVDVYIPSVSFSPFYNVGTAAVSDWTTSFRNVATPVSSIYNIDDWTGGTKHYCFRDDTISYASSYFRMDNLLSTFNVKVYDADGTTVLAEHEETINGNIDVTNDNIRIQITNFVFEYGKYKAQSNVEINMASILPDGGRISVKIEHINATVSHIKTQDDIFYDPEPFAQSLSGVTIAENTLSSSKYLSGIRYYDIGDSFDIGISDLDYLNADTYPDNFVTVTSNTYYGISNFNLAGSNLTNWNSNYNKQDASYSGTKSISRTSFRYIGTSGIISAQVQDWIAGASSNSSSKKLCVDTWTPESGDLSEYFTDENYRRKSDDGIWDSTQDLSTYDDTYGMMVQDGKLMTRRTDWNTYYPALTSNPDYSSFTGWGTYYRRFIDASSLVRGSCQMSISGFTLQNLIDEDVKIWIMIPGRWTSECYLHGSSTFDYGTFNGDNDPIRTLDSTSNVIKMSFGTLGLDSTYNYFILHMEIQSTSIQPDSIIVSF